MDRRSGWADPAVTAQRQPGDGAKAKPAQNNGTGIHDHFNFNFISQKGCKMSGNANVYGTGTPFFPSLDYCDSILIYKEVLRLRPSVQEDPSFGVAGDGPASTTRQITRIVSPAPASETFEYIPRQQARKRCSRRAGKCARALT